MECSTEKVMQLLTKPVFLKVVITGINLLFLAGLSTFGQERYSFNRKRVNWGFKAGLNANAMMHLQVMQGEEKLPDASFCNKTGNDIIGFFRINLDRFFIQPELGWAKLKYDISFSFPLEDDSKRKVGLSFKTQSVNLNGLIGYNITKTGPFVFNVIVGSSLRYRFDIQYLMQDTGSKYKSSNPAYNPYGLLGFSMNISNVHFDVRYAISMVTANLNFDPISDKPDFFEGVTVHKRENILSFSCGVMF